MTYDYAFATEVVRATVGFLAEQAILIPDLSKGDFDSNGVLDVADIDLLSNEIRLQTHRKPFDLTGDSLNHFA